MITPDTASCPTFLRKIRRSSERVIPLPYGLPSGLQSVVFLRGSMQIVSERFSINRILFLFLLAVLLSCSSGATFIEQNGAFYDPRSGVKEAFVRPTATELTMERSRLTDKDRARVERTLANKEPGLALYRDPGVRGMVIDYFCSLTENETVALSILYHADHENVPLTLAFSLAWVESRYSPNAVNVNSGSVDRGIFQLNSLSFPYLSDGDFFDADLNVQYGVRHLRYCLDRSHDDARALEIYNAGLTSVLQGRIPASTRSYVHRILQFQRYLVGNFRSFMKKNIQPPTAASAGVPDARAPRVQRARTQSSASLPNA